MPAEKKPASTRKAVTKKVAAARAEVAETLDEKFVEFRGSKFVLPDKPPGSLLFAVADMEDGRGSGGFAILRDLLGEDGFREVRDIVARDGLDIDEASKEIEALIEDINGQYGTTTGE